jgi:hypothetical protein
MTLTQMGLVDKRKNSANQGLELVVSSVKLELWFEMKGSFINIDQIVV